MNENSNPLLSICIATYNRKGLVLSLVNSILRCDGEFEICVHVDGSTDSTFECLSLLNDERLKVSYSLNEGRASAIYSAVQAARGRFLMIFDDDDDLYSCGLSRVLEDCRRDLPPGCVGFIYHLEDENGDILGSVFPVEVSNFISLRADCSVKGDKKEVVLSKLMKEVVGLPLGRRVPTSLYWSMIALRNDVLCVNYVVGRKKYMINGMTSQIVRLKRSNASPMVDLYKNHMLAFFKGRYRSPFFFAKAIIAYSFYVVRGLARK